MNLDVDIILLYSENDNLTSTKVNKGWVTQFHRFLEIILTQILGFKPSIVLSNEHHPTTDATLKNTAILLSIISKDFVNSATCVNTVERFYQHIEGSKEPKRMFKAMKMHVHSEDQPKRLSELLSYDLFQTDLESTVVKEYTDFFIPEAEQQFWMKLVDLAYDIHDSIYSLKGLHKKSTKNIFKHKGVYIAETGNDLTIQRSILRRELLRLGFDVRPTQLLPNNVADIEKIALNDMRECVMSVHLIGNNYGQVPQGSQISIVEILNNIGDTIAKEKNENDGEFLKMTWISPSLKHAGREQMAFISNLKRNAENQPNSDVLQNSIEDFKYLIREELVKQKNVKVSDISGRSLYLIYNQIDKEEVNQIKKIVSKSDIKVLEVATEGDLLSIRKHHIENLCNMDGALIYKGKVNNQWIRMKILDLLKAPGYGRKKPIRGKAIFTQGDLSSLKEFSNQNITLLTGDISRPSENFKAFIEQI